MSKLFRESLATVILSGRFELNSLKRRIRNAISLRSDQSEVEQLPVRWIHPLSKRILAQFGTGKTPPRLREVVDYLRGFRLDRFEEILAIDTSRCPALSMTPAHPRFQEWNLPKTCTSGELASRLEISPEQLLWLSRHWTEQYTVGDQPRYQIHWQRGSNNKRRLLEVPSPVLKRVQRVILREVLDKVPAHDAAHGFRRQRSVITSVIPHVAQTVTWKIDLASFFLSIPRRRVEGLFRMLGYPETMAGILTRLTTNALSSHEMRRARKLLSPQEYQELSVLGPTWHLPQGAVTSPALANLIAYRLDCRLTGLATSYSANYTRYADDLIFSGDGHFRRHLQSFRIAVMAIVQNEGFLVRHHKSRVMPHSRRQQALGIVLNDRPNLPRDEYKRLHAILHNCTRTGPEAQNRDGHIHFRDHLAGKISHVRQLNPTRADHLQRLMDQIRWD